MTEPLDVTVLALIVIGIQPLTGLIVALTPYLMKKSEVFTVTVPESAIYDPYLKKLKRHFSLFVLLATVAFMVPTVLLFVFDNLMGAVICTAASSLIVILFSYGLMLRYRKKVNSYKEEQGWVATHKEAVSVLFNEDMPKAISLKWNLLYLPIFCVTALVGFLGYGAMPEQIPIQFGVNGEIGNWMAKSPLAIWIPVLIEVFFAACFFVSHLVITRSKRTTDPSAPAASAYAYGMFAHAQSLYLISGGLFMTAAMIAMPLSFMGVLSILQSGVFLAIAVFVLVVGAIVISVVYGQGGSRVFRRMQESTELLADNDEYWKLGIFYFNPEDPNLFLPARFGIGWTCNFARPLVWVITLACIALTVGFVVLLLALM